uniref:GDP-mannose 4,6 dehydratase n=1 Tax=Timema cristinae TaxID=61476 RepID=A0A7R9CQD9_TIMCR|nr:unnamed protein product [Timema cristinae]
MKPAVHRLNSPDSDHSVTEVDYEDDLQANEHDTESEQSTDQSQPNLPVQNVAEIPYIDDVLAIPSTHAHHQDVDMPDGSYLAEFLLAKGYEVHGIIRRASTFNTARIQHLYADPKSHRQGRMKLHYGDMTDSSCLVKIISTVKPSEIYNLAAQSHVKVSFDLSEYTAEVDAVGTLRLLDAIRTSGLDKQVKFYQASTSELYGKVQEVPQKETTPFYPRSPYACAKLYGYWIVVNYREAYNMFACNGILFNHESPRRGESFVTRKITRSVSKIALVRPPSFVTLAQAMWLMLQQSEPEDFVIATGETHSVREFVEAAFRHIGKEIVWEGAGESEVGKEKGTGVVRVRINPKYFRPTEVDLLLGDPSKAKEKFGWTPKVTFKELVKDMMDSDLELMKKNPAA